MSGTAFLLQPIFEQPAFRLAQSRLESCAGQQKASGANLTLSGLTRTAKAAVVAGLAHALRRPLLLLTSDNEAADQLGRAAATLLEWLEPDGGARAASLPAYDCSPYAGRSPHPEILQRRAGALWNAARGQIRILVAPLAAALGRFRDGRYYCSLAKEVKQGERLPLDELTEYLLSVGYETNDPVGEVGQFAVRGGIVDIFPPERDWPVRIELFDDRVESLREFDPTTQRSRSAISSALVLPLAEARRSQKFFQKLARQLAQRLPQPGVRPAAPDWVAEYSGAFPGWEFFAPLAEPHSASLTSLLEKPVVVWDEPAERHAQLKRILASWGADYEEVRDMVPPRPRPEDMFLTEQEFHASVEALEQLSLQELAVEGNGGSPVPMGGAGPTGGEQLCLRTQPAPKFHCAVNRMVEEVRQRLQRGERVILAVPPGGKAERMREILSEYSIPFGHASGLEEQPPPGLVWLAEGELEEGVAFPEQGLLLLSDRDLFGESPWGRPSRREKSSLSTFISGVSDLRVGDYVVHVDHGIGRYQGLRQLEVDGLRRDFMLLTYQDDAKLYVPLERLDLVEKYRSGGAPRPALDRLGGTTWLRTKTHVKRALRDMAQELLQLYAQRKMRGGVSFSAATPWQKEFEDAFEFEETPDQLSALAEIARDQEAPAPMDRLLCGDVGYGKTELAMRAAFKVVQDSYQVAVLAPTTVLAFQHYNTFRQRMAAFPVRVEMLSRFRSAAEQRRILAEVESGQVDILIGTHRMLSKDVRFRRLGLLIVDEEQRFGVAAKERLKQLQASVDVLTMSATPIPRTLHMALGGLRDLSVIETPPRGRLAIQTTVAPFSQSLIQSAILQEMERHGQTYFVHNRVESIHSMAALVARLVPTARIGVTHGQMRERELERVMLKFMQGHYDVLVSTALIENGLDIPRANTLIVNRADRFGLADLYQLRGRVGRSDRRAYAYFLIPAEESLSPTARRRLAALKEFADLGAGFRLAALDLELRGAGNLLGSEQHGHLNAVGIDLYLKMLEQTVEELKGRPSRPEVRTTLNLGLDIRIPERYIADEQQRLRMYKRISSLTSPQARAELESELVDRYGPLPPSVVNLLGYGLLKTAAEQLFIQSIEIQRDSPNWCDSGKQASGPGDCCGFHW